jgi:hypothetical protein
MLNRESHDRAERSRSADHVRGSAGTFNRLAAAKRAEPGVRKVIRDIVTALNKPGSAQYLTSTGTYLS